MMKNTSTIICFIFLLAQSKMTLAQSIEELFSISLENNLELKSLDKEYLAALEKAPQVSQMPNPEIGVGVFPMPVETRLGAQVLRFGSTQMLPWPGILGRQKELELAKARPLSEKVQARKLELEYELKTAYFKLYEIEKSQSIIQENIVIFQALERLALSKVESGRATIADILLVQMKIQEILQEIEILEKEKEIPLLTVNQILNRDLDAPIDISDSLVFAELIFNKNELIENMEKDHPVLNMYFLQQEVSQKKIDLNNLAAKPTFGIGADYIVVGKRTDAEPVNNGRDILQFRGVVKVPLYQKKFEAKEREENLMMEVFENRRLDIVSQFKSDIEKAYSEHESARLKKELFEKQVELINATIDVLETNYSSEGQGFEELLRLEKELVDYKLKTLRAIVQSHLAKSSIERFVAQ